MKRTIFVIVLLGCAAVISNRNAFAQARSPASPAIKQSNRSTVFADDERARKLAELDTWLRRLAGRFRYDGLVDTGRSCVALRLGGYCSNPGVTVELLKPSGTSDCESIGTGSGVHCIINVSWPDDILGFDGDPALAGVSPLDPAMILYGIDPDGLAIRYLQVNNKSVAEAASGFLNGNVATFKTPCVNAPAGCQRIIRIKTNPDGKTIEMWVETWAMFTNSKPTTTFMCMLRRISQDEAKQISMETK